MQRLFRRVKALLRWRQQEQDLQNELAAHVAMDTQERIEAGESPETARRAAWRDFGNVALVTEDTRAAWGWTGVEQFAQDLRHGARLLIRGPGFTIAATVTLALGTGATATVFSLLDTVLLRPLPVQRPEELAHIYTSCRRGDPYCVGSYPQYLDYRAQSRMFADMAAFHQTRVSLGAGSGSWIGTALLVSTNYFTLLGVAPHAGQLISPAWNVAADPPVVLAHDTWLARFGGDQSAIGRGIRVSGATFRIAGVAPLGFHGTRLDVRPDLWLAIDNVRLIPQGRSGDMLTNRGRGWLGGIIGRLRPGATIEQASVDMRAISDGLQRSDPDRAREFVTVESAERAVLPPGAAADITRFVVLLMSAVGAALLHTIDPTLPVTEIAPLDDRIAELLMPQRLGSALLSALGGLTIVLVIVGAAGTVAYGVSRRRREIGVRLALGARRAQVAGAMTRGALVSMASGVLAGIIGAAALGGLASAFLYGIEPTDATSFVAAAVVIVLATGAASFLPAWRAAGIDRAEILKAE